MIGLSVRQIVIGNKSNPQIKTDQLCWWCRVLTQDLSQSDTFLWVLFQSMGLLRAFSLEVEGVAECVLLQCWCSHWGRWKVSLQDMWSLGKWSVTKFIVMPHFRTKSASKLLAQKQAQTQIPMTSCHTETGDFTHNNPGNGWQRVMLSFWNVRCFLTTDSI